MGEGFAVQAIVLDIFDPGFDLALAFRILAFAGPDRKAGRGRILMEALIQGQFSEPLVDHDQLGLIIHAFSRTAAEIERRTGSGLGCGWAMLHILAGENPAPVAANHGLGIEPCRRTGKSLSRYAISPIEKLDIESIFKSKKQ
jgi:hypothetical protein